MSTDQIKKDQLFDTPRYIQNSFNIIFARQVDIRKKINDFESKLADSYRQPHIPSVPDEFPAEIPRIIFESTHSYSQIAISQMSIAFNVTYSLDWQTSTEQRKEYLAARIPILLDLLGALKTKKKSVKPFYCGFTTLVRIPCLLKDEDTLKHLSKMLGVNMNVKTLFDVQQKTAIIGSDKYFSNVTIENYRTWEIGGIPQAATRLQRRKAKEQGIQIIGDFNDKYAFQERKSYFTNQTEAATIVDLGQKAVQATIEKLME